MAVIDDERVIEGRVGATVDADRIARATFAFVAGSTVMVVGVVMLYSALVRPPWLDELASHYFVTSAGDFLTRYQGDPHPVGYYLPLIPAAWVSDSFGFLRIVGLIVPSVAAVALSWAVGTNRTRLTLIAPAACGSALFVAWGADLRMYGALGICSAVLAVTVYDWTEHPRHDRRTIAALAGLLILVACLHVWGALIAAVYGAIVVGRLWTIRDRVERSIIDVAVLLAIVTTGAAYALGPPFNSEAPIPFTDRGYAWTLVAGVSASLGVVAVVGIVWLIASTFPDSRRVTMMFDVPATVVVLVVWVVSQVQPIAKQYSPTPLAVIFLTGLLIRLRGRAPWLGVVVLVALLAGNLSTLRTLDGERQSFAASSAYLVDNYDGDCPVLTFPTNHDLHATRQFVDLPLLPLTEDGIDAACSTGWVIANHVNATEARLSALVDLDVQAEWGDALVARYVVD